MSDVRYYPVKLSRWDAEIIVIRVDDGLFFSVSNICAALGVKGPSMQVTRLQKDTRFIGNLQQLPVDSGRGPRTVWCIRKHATAWWIASIEVSRVRPEVRDTLQEFQFALMEVADRLMFGDLRGVLDVDGSAVTFERPIRGEIHHGCPNCGAPLCLVIDNSGVHVVVGQATEPPAVIGDALSTLPDDDSDDD